MSDLTLNNYPEADLSFLAPMHNRSKHPLYPRWRAMMAKCYSPLSEQYSAYGKVGVKVCRSWHSFENYIADVDAGRKPGLVFARVDFSGHFSPENCRWATKSKSLRTRRPNVRTYRYLMKKEISEIQRWYKFGYTSAWIAKKFKCSESSVYRHLKAA